jgi:transposase
MITLDTDKKVELERMHREAKDGRHRDRIKAILLNSEGWEPAWIAQALRLTEETVCKHLRAYQRSEKLRNAYRGTEPKLDKVQETELILHLETNFYETMEAIRAHVNETYGVSYSHQGMHNWLKRHNFSYKKPKGTPAKANPEAQEEFKRNYEELKKKTPDDEPILFGDGVHPTQGTKVTGGWIRKGKDRAIATTGARTRLNITGALNLEDMQMVSMEHETINGEAIVLYLEGIRVAYPTAPWIHLILDGAGYHKDKEVLKAAERLRIKIYYLPPYSPNLNPIERVWKVMNERVRNNVYFKTAQEFREAIRSFFQRIWPQIALSLIDRINDNFQKLLPLT